MEFIEFPKIARLNRACTITEKIDGTNAQVFLVEACGDDPEHSNLIARVRDQRFEVGYLDVFAGSRTRWITPTADNYGFAAWVKANAEALSLLGPGSHFGEWWGAGIQRRYGVDGKRFSLFNTARWRDKLPTDVVGLVPTLHEGQFSTGVVDECIAHLKSRGSVAAPGFMKPEGVVVYMHANRTMYKVTCEKDAEHKGAA